MHVDAHAATSCKWRHSARGMMWGFALGSCQISIRLLFKSQVISGHTTLFGSMVTRLPSWCGTWAVPEHCNWYRPRCGEKLEARRQLPPLRGRQSSPKRLPPTRAQRNGPRHAPARGAYERMGSRRTQLSSCPRASRMARRAIDLPVRPLTLPSTIAQSRTPGRH